MDLSFDDVELWGHDDHVHDFHQFIVVISGHAVLRAGGRDFELTSSAGLWIPAGVVHRASFSPDSLLLPLNFAVEPGAGMPARPTRIAMVPELRAALGPALRAVMLELDGEGPIEAAYRALREATETGRPLLSPKDGAAAAVARWLLAHPEDNRTLGDWSAELFVSEATIRRAFRAETGLSFARWRNLARMRAAVPLLSRGLPVSVVASRVGFASANGFIAAFRREFGRTPGRYGSLAAVG